MLIKIIRSTIIGGIVRPVGEVVEGAANELSSLVQRGRAIIHKAEEIKDQIEDAKEEVEGLKEQFRKKSGK